MEAIKGIRSSQINQSGKVHQIIIQQYKSESDERDENEEDEQHTTTRLDPEGSHKVDPSFSAKLKGTDATTEPIDDATRTSIAQALETRKDRRKDKDTTIQPTKRATTEPKEATRTSTAQALDTRKARQEATDITTQSTKRATLEHIEAAKTSIAQAEDNQNARRDDADITTQPSTKRAWIAEIPETRKLSQTESEETKTTVQDETIKKTIRGEIRRFEKDAMSRVSTEYTRDTIYSADYSSVPPYKLMRPKNLTLWKLLCSLEMADCMPLGPYDYNVEYDEIFSVGDEEVPNHRWFRRRDTFYSADSRSYS
jgi:hypothetical protein